MLPAFMSGSLLKTLARPTASRCGSLLAASTQTRAFASVLPEVPVGSKSIVASSSKATTPEGHLRPHLGIEVDPNHGLYAFFRRVEKDGEVDYETLEPRNPARQRSGRSWSAAELRRKSFKDLHTLWYILLRERNLLASQRAEARRIGVQEVRLASYIQTHKVRKSMARIKYVINERRLAYEGAVGILEFQNRVSEEAQEENVLQTKTPKETEKASEETARSEPAPASEMAAAGLFGSSSVEPPQNAKEA